MWWRIVSAGIACQVSLSQAELALTGAVALHTSYDAASVGSSWFISRGQRISAGVAAQLLLQVAEVAGQADAIAHGIRWLRLLEAPALATGRPAPR